MALSIFLTDYPDQPDIGVSGVDVVTAVSAEISASETQFQIEYRAPSYCFSSRECLIVGRGNVSIAVQGTAVLANPTHILALPNIADTDAYDVFLVDDGNVLESPPRESQLLPTPRLAGRRGNR